MCGFAHTLLMKREIHHKNSFIHPRSPFLWILFMISKQFESDKTSWDPILLLFGSVRTHKYLNPILDSFPFQNLTPLFTSSGGKRRSYQQGLGEKKKKIVIRCHHVDIINVNMMGLFCCMFDPHSVLGQVCCFCWLNSKASCLLPPAVCKCAAVAGCSLPLSSMLHPIALQLCGWCCHKSAMKEDPNSFTAEFTDASS